MTASITGVFGLRGGVGCSSTAWLLQRQHARAVLFDANVALPTLTRLLAANAPGLGTAHDYGPVRLKDGSWLLPGATDISALPRVTPDTLLEALSLALKIGEGGVILDLGSSLVDPCTVALMARCHRLIVVSDASAAAAASAPIEPMLRTILPAARVLHVDRSTGMVPNVRGGILEQPFSMHAHAAARRLEIADEGGDLLRTPTSRPTLMRRASAISAWLSSVPLPKSWATTKSPR